METSLDCHIYLSKADYIFVDDFHPLDYGSFRYPEIIIGMPLVF